MTSPKIARTSRRDLPPGQGKESTETWAAVPPKSDSLARSGGSKSRFSEPGDQVSGSVAALAVFDLCETGPLPVSHISYGGGVVTGGSGRGVTGPTMTKDTRGNTWFEWAATVQAKTSGADATIAS